MQAIPSEFLAIDRKQRANTPTFDVPTRLPKERVCDFNDIHFSPDEAIIRYEASRCIHCPDPAPCVRACPADNDIPSAMWLIEQGRYLEAAALYRQTSSMPEICGRVCPQEALCQASCVRSRYGEPVLTGMLEAFVTDFDRRHRHQQNGGARARPNGKKVAIVGAGPAGLACAEQLSRQGYQATLFDARERPGGLLLYGIPNFKLPKDILAERIDEILQGGVEFVGNTFIGRDLSVDDLFDQGFEAVFVGIGTGVDATMRVEGEDLPGVYKGTEFLIRANVDPAIQPAGMGPLPEIGKRLVVVGGGDTASDCLRSALRLGAEEVTCIYRRTEKEMPGSAKDRTLAREEGATYQFLTQPVRFIEGEEGCLAALECIRMELGEPDDSGRRRPVPIEGSNFILEADTAVLAVGYWPDPVIGETTPQLETHKWGLIVADPQTGATTRPGIFAGGDAVTGPDLVVTAMVAGRQAAAAIDRYLQA